MYRPGCSQALGPTDTPGTVEAAAQGYTRTLRSWSARPKLSARDASHPLTSLPAAGPAVPAHRDQVPPLHRSIAGAQALLATAAAGAAAAPIQAPQAPGSHDGLTHAPPLSRATPLAPDTCLPGYHSVFNREGAGGGGVVGKVKGLREGVEKGEGLTPGTDSSSSAIELHTYARARSRAHTNPLPSRAPPTSVGCGGCVRVDFWRSATFCGDFGSRRARTRACSPTPHSAATSFPSPRVHREAKGLVRAAPPFLLLASQRRSSWSQSRGAGGEAGGANL